jgi:hypothetical protein
MRRVVIERHKARAAHMLSAIRGAFSISLLIALLGAAPLALAQRIRAAGAATKPAPSSGGATSTGAGADRSGIQEIALGVDPGTPLSPDAEPKSAHPLAAQPILMAGSSGTFGERDRDILFASTEAGIAAVCHLLNEVTRVERIDLAAGRSLNTVTLPGPSRGMDLSPNGKLLLSHNVKFGFGVSDRLDVWNIVGGSEPQRVISFKPYEDLEGGARDVQWGQFITNERFVTLNSEGRIILWDVNGKGIWAVHAAAHNTGIAISPSRKYLAVNGGPTIAILDAQTGGTLRLITDVPAINTGPHPGPRQDKFSFAFKPDGAELAIATQDLLFTFDLTSGAVSHEVYPSIPASDFLCWCGGNYLLAGGSFVGGEQYLVGVDQQMIVWQFVRPPHGHFNAGRYFGGRYWYTAPPLPPAKGKPVMIGVAMPDPKVAAALSKIKFDDQMAIHPGVSVSLQVDLPDDIKEKVTTTLKATLARNGLTVADGQPIKLVASTEQGKAREMKYVPSMFAHLPGNVPNTTKMNVNELIQRLSFVDGDHKLWERTLVIQPPGAVRQKKDQSVENAVTEAMRPTEHFFIGTMIPKRVPRMADGKGFGKSQLTPQGALPAAP